MTATSLLDELEGVAAARAEWVELDSDTAWNELALLSVNFVSAHHAEITDMAKRLEAAERDAERYRWLRNQAIAGVMTTPCHGSLNCDEPESEWDAWIDAATQEGEG